MIQLAYDTRDDPLFEQRRMQNLYWLDDLGAVPLNELDPSRDAFLYAGARSIDDYRKLVSPFSKIRDRPEARGPLLTLDSVLACFDRFDIDLPRPRTWLIGADDPIPNDLIFPLFVRTPKSSWKLGGKISKVSTEKELMDEAFELRRAFGVDQPVMAREWLDIESVGQTLYGPVPLEIRVWIVDSVPFAWSFHHLRVDSPPSTFPLDAKDIAKLFLLAGTITCFDSRLICADFVKTMDGDWCFLEAGLGSCAGTAHEFVFKSVAAKLGNLDWQPDWDAGCKPDAFGQLF